MTDQETIYTMALTRVPHIGTVTQRLLYDQLGSATAIFENSKDIRAVVPDATPKLEGHLKDLREPLKRAEAEFEYLSRKNITCLCLNDGQYPAKLRECPDAPLALYYCGRAGLTGRRVVSVVGTRHLTEYGKDLCRNFIKSLSQYFPDAIIASGLAYGADICAHKAALECGMDTVGILAHGLDTIYPAAHRSTAGKMAEQGGLLTEYMSGTRADKGNFVRRNRIVAGISDATVVIESAEHGGSLITAELASEYNRDVYAFPGRVSDKYSEGCNNLIRDNKATLIQGAEDFLNASGWIEYTRRQPVQTELFPQLTPDEEKITASLKDTDSKSINQIVVETGISINQASSILFDLEMRGIVANIGGSRYRLVMMC